MKLIHFSNNFKGFQEGEDILVDTGILFAYYNEYDAYYSAVKELFENHIYNNDKTLFLYVNPTVVNEITHLAKDPLKKYFDKFPGKKNSFEQSDIYALEKKIVSNVKQLIENEILYVLDGDEESVKKQLEIYESLGAADAVNASIANLFGTSFLTVDAKLAHNMKEIEEELPNIQNIYYTTARHRDY